MKDILFKDRDGQYVFKDETALLLHRSTKELSKTFFRKNQTRNPRVLVRTSLQCAQAYYPALRLKPSIPIALTKEENSADGRKINLSLEVFQEPDYSAHEKIDVFLGEFLHEAAHFLHTDFIRGRAERFSNLEHTIHNIVEDERIERIVVGKFPGYALYIRAVKRYLFDKKYIADFEAASFQKAIINIGDIKLFGKYRRAEKFTDDELKLIKEEQAKVHVGEFFKDTNAEKLHVLLGLIRYPMHLTERLVDDNAEFILAAYKILMPYPESFDDGIEATKKLYKLFDEEPKEKGDSGDASDGEKSEEGDGDESSESGEGGKKGGKPFQAKKGETTKEEVEAANYEAASSIERSKMDATDVAEKIDKAFSSDEEKDMSANGSFKDMPLSEIRKMIKEILTDTELDHEDEGAVIDYGSDKKITFEKSRVKDRYTVEASVKSRELVTARAHVVRRLLEREITAQTLCIKSTRSGYFDTNKLVEGHMGVETVYERFGEYKSKKVNVCLLIDQSGSMCSSYGASGKSRAAHARDVAAFFDEALNGVRNVSLFMYGFTADLKGEGSSQLFVYREPGVNNKHTIGNIAAGHENRDGDAIRETGLRVRKFTSEPCIFIMVSDGTPAASGYGGASAASHVRKEVDKLIKRMDFEFIHIAIGSRGDKSMYPVVLDYQSVDDLPAKIGLLMRKFVTRKLKAKLVI